MKKGDKVEKLFVFASDRNKTSAFKFCRSALTEDLKTVYNGHLLAFTNVTVDLRTGEQLPHDKKHFLTSAIPVPYEKNSDCPEEFRQFVIDAYGEEYLPLIRALTSMYLDPTSPNGYFTHIIGPSGSGKGTLLRFWQSMFAEENVRSLNSFKELGNPEGRHQHLQQFPML